MSAVTSIHTLNSNNTPSHHLTTSPPHHLTTSPPHHLTTSPPHHLTTSPPHHPILFKCPGPAHRCTGEEVSSMRMSTSETAIVRACLDWLALHRVKAWRMNNTGIYDPLKKVHR